MDNYKRSNWIDFCRGGGIGLVLLGHTSFPFHKFIYGFHMPLFFLISGLLWHEERSIPYKKYAKRFLIPYAGFAALNFIADIVLHLRDLKSYPYEKKVIGILYSRGTTEWMPNCSPLWFLTCMFMGMSLLYIISQLIMFLLPVRLSTQQVTVFHSTSRLDSEPDAKRSLCGLVACNGVSPPLKTNQLLQWVCVVLCASASVLLGVLGAPKLVWNIDTALMAVLFIWIGFQGKQLIYEKNWPLVIVAGCFGGIAIFINPVKNIEFNDNIYGNPILMVVGAVGVSLFFIKGCYYVGNLGDIVSCYIKWIGKNSIFFMSFDYLSRTVSVSILEKLSLNEWFFVFVLKLLMLSIGCTIWNHLKMGLKRKKFND